MNKPNIFNYATSELSNDAILCWMLEWAKYDGELNQLGMDLINLFTKKHLKKDEIKHINILKQYKHIDILVEINNSDLIIVEDKTFTGDHSEQLETYKKCIEEDSKYKLMEKHYIYLKIGNESYLDDSKLNEYKGYKRIIRTDLLNIFNKYISVRNDILNDYIKYIQDIEDESNQYKRLADIRRWQWKGWEGYYNELQRRKKINEKTWGYVSNRSGGFLGFWWNWSKINYNIHNETIEYYIYLQIETYFQWNDKLKENQANPIITLKIEVNNDEYKSEIRNYVWAKLQGINKERIKKCNFAKGRFMSIAKMDSIETKEKLESSISMLENIQSELEKLLI